MAYLPAFVRHIAPALEKSLSKSLACAYGVAKLLSFYRSGLRLVFEAGKLKIAGPWIRGPRERDGHIAFLGQVFLQLLFACRSLAEIHQSFADCWRDSNETRVLFKALLPRKPAQLYPLA